MFTDFPPKITEVYIKMNVKWFKADFKASLGDGAPKLSKAGAFSVSEGHHR